MSFERPDSEQLSAATSEELALLAADCLARLEPGRQPLPLFKEFGRLTVLSTFEVTPFRSTSQTTEVLLAQRPDNDQWWPSQWHLPGNVLLPTSEPGIHDYNDSADHILLTEFEGTIARTSDVRLFNAQRRSGIRGSEQTVFGWTEVDTIDESVGAKGGRFFDAKKVLSEPPQEGLIEGHELTIQMAVANYLLYQARTS